MTDAMTTDECLASQTHGCCEGGRRPSWQERKKLTKEGLGHYYPDDPGPCCDTPIDLKDVHVAWIDPEKATAALLDERAKDYGPPEINMTGIGLIWTAQLRNHYGIADLPIIGPEMVALMMAGLKLNRLAKSPKHQDSYDDARGYLQIAESAG